MLDLPPPPAWTEDALCAQVGDPDLWYPEKGYTSRSAKRVCSACPVATECRADAIEHEDPWGIWGGLSGPEREQYGLDGQPEARPCAHCGGPIPAGIKSHAVYCSTTCVNVTANARRKARGAAA